MDLRFKRTLCNCQECPLRGNKKVLGYSKNPKPTVVIIGGAPHEDDVTRGKPFESRYGKMLIWGVSQSGLQWDACYKLNVLSCRPTNDRIDLIDGREALTCCLPGFIEELKALEAQGVSAGALIGDTPMAALGLEGALTKARGSVFPYDKMNVVPTYAPEFILRGQQKLEGTMVADLMKVRDLAIGRWKPLEEHFNIFPTLKELTQYADDIVASKKPVGIDIEGCKTIAMVGVARDSETAMVIPFVKQGGLPYWRKAELPKAEAQLRRILTVPTIYQNALFDVYHLEEHGFPVKEIADDTMLIHHCLSPELPHDLGFIVSVYGKTPYWKDLKFTSDEAIWKVKDEKSRTYNARDAVVLMQILPELKKDLKEMGTEWTYKNISLELIRPLLAMKTWGLRIDTSVLKKVTRQLNKATEKAECELRSLGNLPINFNLNSGPQMTRLFYGTFPASHAKRLAEIDEYRVNTKLSKNTKKYRELCDAVDIMEHIQPFPKLATSVTKLDEEAMISLERSIIGRLSGLEGRAKMTEKMVAEISSLEKYRAFIRVYREYSETHKILSTYTKFDIDEHGYIHPDYLIHGTATGRLSSRNPNAQNQPESILQIYVPGEGRCLIKPDYSNIEYRMLAYITGEVWLQQQFEAGANFHDLNTMMLFGIDKSDPDWKHKRRIAKTFIFALSYGSTIEGIYKKILVEDPDFKMTFAEFSTLVDAYFAKMPHYNQWRIDIQKQVAETRITTTEFGRKRIYLGDINSIKRQALDTPIQGSAGEVAELALIRIYKQLQKHPEWDAHLCVTVHDSIGVDSPVTNKLVVAKMMKKEMEAPVAIKGAMRVFPVDVEIGDSWGTVEKVEI